MKSESELPKKSVQLRKSQSHGRIGEAAVTAKCWMNGIPAHNTNGLRANFAGADLIVDTCDLRKKLLIQVKSGYSPANKQIYLTQASGEQDLEKEKFHADFVVFVNIDKKVGEAHNHQGTLDFQHLTYFVVPGDMANKLFREALAREFNRPKRDGTKRSLSNLAVNVDSIQIEEFSDAWHLLRETPLAI